ncbi:Ig-like domain-containing protein [Paenibacillus koleovorans]|uniref:Ig-like domain-containing protein n=1 Tax=Paenibacillus koleovorans TaxID=121608 RepID=UPI000FD8B8F9|nr:Ig-like domain-containing protein [Paenibacillus koleovorans]
MKRGWKQMLLLILLITGVIPVFPGAASASVLPFYASAQTSGTMTVKLYPTENVDTGVSTLVTFGVPFTRGSVAPADLTKIRVLKGGIEIPAYVAMQTPWRHITNPALDGTSVRVATVQIPYTFTSAFPNSENITIEWGTTTRTQNISTLTDPKTAWHQVVSGTFVATDNIYEPDVYAVLPKDVLSNGTLNPQRMNPMDDAIGVTRDDPSAMKAVEHYPGFDELDYAFKNFFYTVINEDNIAVTETNPYKASGDKSETWLYDRSSTMYDLYFRSGSFKALREATRSTEFYASKLWDKTTTPIKAIGLFKLKATTSTASGGNNSMYSYNEPFAYNYWLTGNAGMLEPIDWIVHAHENNTESTRWSAGLVTWTERHTAFRLLANVIAYEVLGLTKYKDKIVSQTEDFIWHQNGAGGAMPSGYVDGGLYHKGSQHGDGVGTDFVASSWMTILLQQSMIRAYSLTQDSDIANFVKRVGNFLKAAVKYDPYHGYDTYSGTLPYPDYMMKYDGTTDSVSGGRGSPGNPAGGSTIDHNISIATGLLWSEYFNQLLGGSPDSTITDLAMDLYYGYDIGVNYYTRPAGPASGKAAFRVSPWRKWSWEYKPAVSLSWLANQLGVSPQLPPDIAMSAPAEGQIFSEPATIGIDPLVTANTGSIAKVEFFNGVTKLGEKTSPPYNYTWSSVAAGSYAIKVKATDSNGKSSETIRNVRVIDTTGLNNFKAAIHAGQFKTYPLGTQTGTFTVELDAMPLAATVDGGVSLSLGSAGGSWSMPAVVRFGTAGKIEARDNITYVGPGTPITYSANQIYHLRIVVDTAGKTYSAYVTPPGGSELTIATNIAFRSTPVVSSLNTLNVMGDIGGLLVGNVTGGTGDVTAPTVSISAPSASSTISGSTTITASATDATGVSNVQLFIDGIQVGNTLTTSPYTTTFNAATLSNGTHTITAKAVDAAGNTSYSAPVSVTVTGGGSADSTAPTVSITSPSPGTVSGSISLSASATDDVRVGGVTFLVDGKQVTPELMSAPFSTSYNTSSLTSGNHTITAVARDTSGNTTTSTGVVVNVTDSTPPQGVISMPAPGTIYTTSFLLSAVASDNAGVAGVRFYANGTPLAAEDTTVPYSLTVNSGILSAGSYALTAVIRDTSNNTYTTPAVNITFSPDSTAPAVSVTSPAASSTNSGFIVLTANATDNYGVSSVQFKVDGNPIGEPLTSAPYTMTYNTMGKLDGSHTFTATAVDVGGNATTSSGVNVTFSNNSGGSGTVTYQYGVDNYTFTKDVGITSQSSGNTTASKTGADINIYNQLQQASPYQMFSIIRFDDITIPLNTKVDSATLTVRMNSNVNPTNIDGRYLNSYWNYDSAHITWNKRDLMDFWNTPGANGDGTDFISGKSFSTTLTTGWQVKTITLDPGVVQSWVKNPDTNHGVKIIATTQNTTGKINGSENTTEAYRPKLSITYSPSDTTPPTVSVTSPTGGATLSGVVNLTANASDNVGVEGVQFYFNGIAAGAEDTVAPYDVSFDTSALTPGSYTVTAVARDAAGNTTTSSGVNVTVAAPAPVTVTFQEGVSSYTGTKDITIRSAVGGSSYTSTEAYVYNKTDLPTGAYEIQGLLRFDDISIPTGKTVTSASLKLTFINTSQATIDVTGYYLNTAWGATTATWANKDTSTPWNTAGARGVGTDIKSGLSFTVPFTATGNPVVKTITLDTATVQDWLDNPSNNHGVLLYSAVPGKIIRFYTSEHATTSYRPELSITYQ